MLISKRPAFAPLIRNLRRAWVDLRTAHNQVYRKVSAVNAQSLVLPYKLLVGSSVIEFTMLCDSGLTIARPLPTLQPRKEDFGTT